MIEPTAKDRAVLQRDATTIFSNNKINDMSAFTDKVKGNWNQIKGELKQKYAELTDDDLTYAEGKEDEWLGRIQEKTGEAKEQIKKWIDSF